MKHNSIKSSMKTSLPSFLVILILINSCTSQSDKNFKKFTLQGEINGQDSGIVVLSYPINGTLICDTAKIKNGKFIFTGRVFEPTRVSLRGRNSLELAWVYLEPRNMKITIFKGKPLGFKMTGSKTQTELDLLNKMEKTLTERLSMLREQLFNIDDSIKNLKPGPAKQLLKKKAEETAKRKTQVKTTTKAVKQVKEVTNSAEKTTLGDISELAALRTQMEADELKEN